MKNVLTKVLQAIALGTLIVSSVTFAQPGLKPSPAPQASAGAGVMSTRATETDQLIIKFNEEHPRNKGLFNAMSNGNRSPNSKAMARLSALAEGNLTYKRGAGAGAHVVKLDKKKNLDEVRGIAKKLAADSELVEYAEPDIRMFPMATTPNDEFYADYQWHLQGYPQNGMNLTAGWDYTTGSSDVVVAVVDTGIRYDHPDFNPNRLLPGYDMISDAWKANDGDGRDNDATDPGNWVDSNESAATGCPVSYSSWHGTHVAGTIGAASNNSLGVAGVDWNAKILPVRVLGKCGGYLSDIGDGIMWAAGLAVPGVPLNPNPADVINLSLGGTGSCDAYFSSVINAAHNNGSTIVAAAGNEARSTNDVAPANCRNVITVAAHGKDGKLASYSNFGSHVDVMAPGGDNGGSCTGEQVVSLGWKGATYPVAYDYSCKVGTSMAAPHVAGLAALMLAIDSDLSPRDVKNLIRTSNRDFSYDDNSCPGKGCGTGLADAEQALDATINFQRPELLVACSQADIRLSSQSQVDRFQATYGGGRICNHIEGTLWIDSAAWGSITNLDGLSDIAQIDRGLSIPNNNMERSVRVDISGLKNLINNGSYMGLRSVSGINSLTKLKTIGDQLIITDIDAENLDGLASLKGVGGWIEITSNPYLQNIDGLSVVRKIDGSAGGVTIEGNAKLANVDGVLNYKPGLFNDLSVVNNASLRNLNGFSYVNAIYGAVTITNNDSLDDCSALVVLLDSVDDGVYTGTGPKGSIPDVGGTVSVANNALGCNSLSEIALDTDNDGFQDHRDAFPNDPSETTDSDSDGVGDNADVFPNDPSETHDTDGDGYGDNSDAFPDDSKEWVDTDGDGYGDNADTHPQDSERWGLVECQMPEGSSYLVLRYQRDIDTFQDVYGGEKGCNYVNGNLQIVNWDPENPFNNFVGLAELREVFPGPQNI